MIYLFYPYFWGRKPGWTFIKSLEDTDSIFQQFLQAGAARVWVPIRNDAYQQAIAYFLTTGGKLWHGGDVAVLPSDPLFVSIADELKERDGQFDGGWNEGEPWIVKVPTTLVMLQSLKDGLPDYSAGLGVPP
jgi:hypothetical protein